jgi:hypothetical protein
LRGEDHDPIGPSHSSANTRADDVDDRVEGADLVQVHLVPSDAASARQLLDGEAAQGRSQLVERQPQIEKGAEQHVARGAGETLEIEHAHVRSVARRLLPERVVRARPGGAAAIRGS